MNDKRYDKCHICGMDVEPPYRDLKMCRACIKNTAPPVKPTPSNAFTGSASDICENCRYGVKGVSDESGIVFLCHRYPPVYAGDTYDSIPLFAWSRVAPGAFCGEFRAKPVEEASDE